MRISRAITIGGWTATVVAVSAPALAATLAFGMSSGGADAGGVALRNGGRATQEWPQAPYDGTFVLPRVRYDDARGLSSFGRFGRGREPMWYHDHPDAEYNIASILQEITYVRPTLNASNIVALEEDRIFKLPMLYMVEPGFWRPTEREIERLREYLLKGGFIVFDDFDSRQMYALAAILQRVLPELSLMPLDGSESVFDVFFHIDLETLRFPGFYRGDQIDFWGIFENNDRNKRLMVIAGNNGDLGDFWEYSATGFYPVDLTNDAYKVGVNYIVYAMTH